MRHIDVGLPGREGVKLLEGSGRIVLTGRDSEREVAARLGEEWLDPAELLCREDWESCL
jgi:hypothetical protein